MHECRIRKVKPERRSKNVQEYRWLSMNDGKAELSNIGPKETRKRLLMGGAMLALGLVLAVVFADAGVSRGWYAALFLPFWMGTLAVSQARKKT